MLARWQWPSCSLEQIKEMLSSRGDCPNGGDMTTNLASVPMVKALTRLLRSESRAQMTGRTTRNFDCSWLRASMVAVNASVDSRWQWMLYGRCLTHFLFLRTPLSSGTLPTYLQGEFGGIHSSRDLRCQNSSDTYCHFLVTLLFTYPILREHMGDHS
jgi:hypothetical protein